jgi:hypothetical protein
MKLENEPIFREYNRNSIEIDGLQQKVSIE